MNHRHESSDEKNASSRAPFSSPQAMNAVINDILAELTRLRGIDFSGYRPGTLRRRLANRMAKVNLSDPNAYLQKLHTDSSEADRLIDVLGVNVTRFFRDPLVFETLAHTVIPELIERKKRQGTKEVRVWSAGCASGDEAYSIAILLSHALRKDPPDWGVHIFASDINNRALQQASQGRYSREHLRETKLGVLEDYFIPVGNEYEVAPSIRRLVHFCKDDLTCPQTRVPAESIFGTFDLVFCRNLLIYFDPNLQVRVLEKLFHSLGSYGHLVLGPSETLPTALSSGLVVVDKDNRIWRKAQ